MRMDECGLEGLSPKGNPLAALAPGRGWPGDRRRSVSPTARFKHIRPDVIESPKQFTYGAGQFQLSKAGVFLVGR